MDEKFFEPISVRERLTTCLVTDIPADHRDRAIMFAINRLMRTVPGLQEVTRFSCKKCRNENRWTIIFWYITEV